MKTLDEVLEYIPKNQYSKYKVNYRGNTDFSKQSSLSKYLLKYNIKDNKMFLVNTIDKTIDVCTWTLKILTAKIPLKFRKDVKYKADKEFVMDSASKILSVKIHYSFTDRYPVGGVMINGAGGYLSGETWHDYERTGTEEYQFCTKTNKYLGYKGVIKESERRKWVEETSGW